MNELTDEQRAAFVAVSEGLYGKFSELVKDKAFFDRTTAFAAGSEHRPGRPLRGASLPLRWKVSRCRIVASRSAVSCRSSPTMPRGGLRRHPDSGPDAGHRPPARPPAALDRGGCALPVHLDGVSRPRRRLHTVESARVVVFLALARSLSRHIAVPIYVGFSVLFFVIMGWTGIGLVRQQIAMHEVAATLPMPMWVIGLIMPVSSVVAIRDHRLTAQSPRADCPARTRPTSGRTRPRRHQH